MGWARRQRAIQFLERLSRPERLFETIHRTARAHVKQGLIDRDGPDPDRAAQQTEHHRFHDPMGLEKQSPNRKIRCDWNDVGRVHETILFGSSRWLQGHEARRRWTGIGANTK